METIKEIFAYITFGIGILVIIVLLSVLLACCEMALQSSACNENDLVYIGHQPYICHGKKLDRATIKDFQNGR